VPLTSGHGSDLPTAEAAERTAAPAPATAGPARRSSLALHLAVIGIVLMGLNRTRVGGWTVSDIAFLLSAAFIVVDILDGREGRLAPKMARRASPPVLLGSILLLTAGTLSAFQSWNAAESMTIVLRFGWITLGFFWVLRSVAADRAGLDKLLAAWRIMILFNCLIAITGQLDITNFGVENAEGRQTAFFEQPNELAGLIATGLPLFLLGVPRRRTYRTDGRDLLSRAWPTAIVLYAIATTGSMTGLIAGAATVLAMLAAGGWRHIRRPGRAWTSPLLPMVVGFLSIVGLVALFNSDLPVVERFTRYTSGDAAVNYSVDSREERNSQVIQRFDESLVVGQGFGSYNPDDPGASDAAGAHNMFFRFIFQAGLPGLVGVLVILLFTLQHGIRLLVNTRGDPLQPTAVALLATFIGANTFAMFQPTEYQRYYWVTAAMIGVLWSVRRTEVREQAAERQAEIDAIRRLPARR